MLWVACVCVTYYFVTVVVWDVVRICAGIDVLMGVRGQRDGSGAGGEGAYDHFTWNGTCTHHLSPGITQPPLTLK